MRSLLSVLPVPSVLPPLPPLPLLPVRGEARGYSPAASASEIAWLTGASAGYTIL